MALVTSLLSSALNPDVEKYEFVNKPVLSEESFDEELIDINDIYFYTTNRSSDKMDILKHHLTQFFESSDDDLKISSRVLSHAHMFLDNIYPSLLEDLDIENVYPTPYGTLVFDWEKNEDDVFSLEIGADSIGYFIEIDGSDIKSVDERNLEESKIETFRDLSSFLRK
mgnify:CR=1 FL=1